MAPIFVQTSSRVIDVSKIAFMHINDDGIVIHFTGTAKTTPMSMAEATILLDEISKLSKERVLTARRASHGSSGK